MRAEDTPGWYEPVAEGLWKPDLLFEIPRRWNWMHLMFGFVAFIDQSMNPIWIAIATHFALGILTMWDPEWPEVLNDLFSEPGDIEP